MAEVVTNEYVEVAGRRVKHNGRVWDSKMNRHTTTSGRSWGWIEGADGNVCWENGQPFDQRASERMAFLHNEWLEMQKPIERRIIAKKTEVRVLLQASLNAEKCYKLSHDQYVKANEELDELLKQSGELQVSK